MVNIQKTRRDWISLTGSWFVAAHQAWALLPEALLGYSLGEKVLALNQALWASPTWMN